MSVCVALLSIAGEAACSVIHHIFAVFNYVRSHSIIDRLHFDDDGEMYAVDKRAVDDAISVGRINKGTNGGLLARGASILVVIYEVFIYIVNYFVP